MKPIFFIQLLTILILTGCSPENESFDTNLEIESADLRSLNCGFTESIDSNSPNIPDTEVIVVQGFSESAITQALESVTSTRRAIFFPRGVYNIPLYTQPNGRLTSRTVLNFNNISDLEIYGEAGTILRMNYGGDYPPLLPNMIARLITVSNSSNIYIHDLDLRSNFNFANSDGATGVSRGDSNIYIRNSNNIHLFDISSSNIAGDGINIGATRNRTTSNIFVKNVSIDNTNRNGITIGGKGQTQNVFISECTFGSKMRSQQIDFEPIEFSNINNIQIENSTFEKLRPSTNASRQGAISVLSKLGNGINCVLIKNNIIRNDIVIARSSSNFVIDGNTEIPSMLIRNNSRNITVSNNDFDIDIAQALDRDRKIAGVLVAANPLSTDPSQDIPYAEPSEIYINDNSVILNGNKTPIKFAFVIRNADAVQAESNHIQFSNPSESNIGFYTKFNKSDLHQLTLNRMRFSHCHNTYTGITSEEMTVAIDVQSDANSILISECN